MLRRGRVSDPNGQAPAVTRYVGELAFAVRWTAVERVEDLHPRTGDPARVDEPLEEGAGLLDAPEGEEGADPDACVARPAEPIVPRMVAAERRRDRCRGGGHRCPRGRIGEQAEGDQAARDHLFV